jgi:hypothetical protein
MEEDGVREGATAGFYLASEELGGGNRAGGEADQVDGLGEGVIRLEPA